MIVRTATSLLGWSNGVRRVESLLRRAWLDLPGDLLARIVLAGCGVPRGAGRMVRVEGSRSTGLSARVVEDARVGRYLDVFPIRPIAQTLGRHILARDALAPATLRHEIEHVRQWERLGPLFLPAYITASGLAVARGEQAYWGNEFEAAARRRETEADAEAEVAADAGTGSTLAPPADAVPGSAARVPGAASPPEVSPPPAG